MSQRAKFIEEILNHPEDDNLRLVYSDWLTEQSDPQGEFIRLQISNKNLDQKASVLAKSRKRERELEMKHGAKWAGSIRHLVDRYQFERGFPSAIKTSLQKLIQNADELFANAPIDSIDIRLGDNRVGDLAELKKLSQVRTLKFRKCRMRCDGVRKLMESPHLGLLESLFIYRGRVEDEGAKSIAECPALQNLKVLSLDSNRLTHQGALELARSRYLTNLTSLDLRSNFIGDQGIEHISNSTNFSKVRNLVLSGTQYTELGIQAFAESEAFCNVETLDLMCSYGGRFGGGERPVRNAAGYLASAKFNQIKQLNLGNQCVGDAGVEAIFGAPCFQTLTDIKLNSNVITDSGAVTIAKSKLLSNLRVLNLEYNHMTHSGLFALAGSSFLKRKSCLYLEGNSISEDHRGSLRKAQGANFGHFHSR